MLHHFERQNRFEPLPTYELIFTIRARPNDPPIEPEVLVAPSVPMIVRQLTEPSLL